MTNIAKKKIQNEFGSSGYSGKNSKDVRIFPGRSVNLIREFNQKRLIWILSLFACVCVLPPENSFPERCCPKLGSFLPVALTSLHAGLPVGVGYLSWKTPAYPPDMPSRL